MSEDRDAPLKGDLERQNRRLLFIVIGLGLLLIIIVYIAVYVLGKLASLSEIPFGEAISKFVSEIPSGLGSLLLALLPNILSSILVFLGAYFLLLNRIREIKFEELLKYAQKIPDIEKHLEQLIRSLSKANEDKSPQPPQSQIAPSPKDTEIPSVTAKNAPLVDTLDILVDAAAQTLSSEMSRDVAEKLNLLQANGHFKLSEYQRWANRLASSSKKNIK